MDNLFYKVAYGATEVDTLLGKINEEILNPFIGLLIAIALLVFIYGVIEFITGADNEDKRTQGKQHIIWGIIGLFIMVSVFGIMNIILSFWEGI